MAKTGRHCEGRTAGECYPEDASASLLPPAELRGNEL